MFLAPLVKKVYAFDIQEKAILMTEEKIKENHVSNVQVIHASHENFASHVKAFKAAIFNLGYLPGGDKSITTQADTTVRTIELMLDLLPVNGFIQIVLYTGHDAGLKEAVALEAFLKHLPTTRFKVMKIHLPFQDNQPPYILMIYKTKDES